MPSRLQVWQLVSHMSGIQLTINGVNYTSNSEPDTPLLWVLRDELGLTGTKYGCGQGICGCCTVHLNGAAIRSCTIPVGAMVNQNITTIEGLSEDGSHPVQKAWVEENVPQCGYCQTGQVMSAVAYYDSTPKLDKLRFKQSLAGNLCRCGTYSGIDRAIDRLVAEKA
jgi:isoquinoline 1-oxidoreductase alpha subunit